MIPIKFQYYRPETLEEAFDLFNQLNAEGMNPFYYGGGTEILSMARANNLNLGAVIDIKGIPECNYLGMIDNKLQFGSTVTLSQITESKLFPLLGQTAGRIADHTIQCKITLGGNLCGTIIYRETSLPLLLCDAIAIVFGNGGKRAVPISQIFNQKLILNQGEILVCIIVDNEYTSMPYIHAKKTKNEKIGYPLLTLTGIKKDNEVRLAFSGLCKFPFRSTEVENYINDGNSIDEEKINRIESVLPDTILGDTEGSLEYRKFVLKNTLENTIKRLEKM